MLSPTNPLGIKAGGEGGTTPALAVIVSAIVDALRALRRPRHRHAGDAVRHLAGHTNCSIAGAGVACSKNFSLTGAPGVAVGPFQRVPLYR